MTSPQTGPLPWNAVKASDLVPIRGVCFDIDDTFSSEGKILPEAFGALWDLKRAGFPVVPITGRPAGWCDHIARFWPVDAVVGENGAFTFFVEGGKRRVLSTPGTDPARRKRLDELLQKILGRFPDACVASDQNYREYDLAIDFCEDVPAWPDKRVLDLAEFCRAQGAHAKISSIHVNIWFGDYDKEKGFRHWLTQGAPGLVSPVPKWEEWLFIGDSPNDEPLFKAFPRSVGVANLKRFLNQLTHPPRWITQNPGGLGFQEMARRILAR